MKLLIALLLVTALAACGSPPGLDRGLFFDETGSPGSVANIGSQTPLRITVLDVGQGDAILIEAPSGETALIDSGPPGAGAQEILPYLEERGVLALTHAILTHDHVDHTGGLSEVLAGPDGETGTSDDITVEGHIYDIGQLHEEDGEPEHEWQEAGAAYDREAPVAGERIELGDCDLEIVAADARLPDGTQLDAGEPPDENARSIVLLLRYSGFAMLLTGDVTGGGGKPPYETPDIETGIARIAGDIDVLKVAHHGSNTSTNDVFLALTDPEIAIISVGDGNDHFHPHPSVIDRLAGAGVAVYQTERGWLDQDGPTVANGHVAVEVDSDGDYRTVLE
jgi:beta-lactamase superfamily II metal-dependent hydrolase